MLLKDTLKHQDSKQHDSGMWVVEAQGEAWLFRLREVRGSLILCRAVTEQHWKNVQNGPTCAWAIQQEPSNKN